MATKRLHYINTPEETFTVRSTGERIGFFDCDDWKPKTRVKWVDCVGFEYVRVNGSFQALSRQKLHDGLKITVGEYRQ